MSLTHLWVLLSMMCRVVLMLIASHLKNPQFFFLNPQFLPHFLPRLPGITLKIHFLHLNPYPQGLLLEETLIRTSGNRSGTRKQILRMGFWNCITYWSGGIKDPISNDNMSGDNPLDATAVQWLKFLPEVDWNVVEEEGECTSLYNSSNTWKTWGQS